MAFYLLSEYEFHSLVVYNECNLCFNQILPVLLIWVCLVFCFNCLIVIWAIRIYDFFFKFQLCFFLIEDIFRKNLKALKHFIIILKENFIYRISLILVRCDIKYSEKFLKMSINSILQLQISLLCTFLILITFSFF